MATYFGSDRTDSDYLAFFEANKQSPFIREAVLAWFSDHGYKVEHTPVHENFVYKDDVLLRDEAFTDVQLQKLLVSLEQMEANPLLQFYCFYWLGGTLSWGIGTHVADAASRCGIGGGALAAMDFYSVGLNPRAFYETTHRTWVFKADSRNSQILPSSSM